MTTENFPAECFEDILSHLSGKDLLTCTLVCPDWNDFIGSTKSTMSKIMITFITTNYPVFNNQSYTEYILMNNERNYQCINLKGTYSENMRRLLTIKQRKWTNIDTRGGLMFSSSSQFVEFLQLIQSSIHKLQMVVTRIKRDVEPLHNGPELQFP